MTTHRLSRRAFFPTGAALLSAGALGASAATPSLLNETPATILHSGVHRIDASMTIKGNLLLEPGAQIEIAAGRTLTLLGSLIAPIAPIFTGAGIVDLNRSRIACAHPEWWGAATSDGTYDSLPAIRACLRAHPSMRLLAADYHVSDTVVIDRPFTRILGEGYRGTQSGQGTRIIVTSATADVIRAGPATAPRAVNDFLQNVTVRDVALCRSMPVATEGSATPAGLRAQFLLFAEFERVSAFEHAVGFVALGLVRSILCNCIAFRSLPGRQARQPYRGFLLDGAHDIGLAGGNASLYLLDCNATIGGNPAVSDAVGLLLEGAFADSFVIDFEATGMETGIRVDGRTATIGDRARNGHVNLHLRMPIIDQCSRVGIEIRDTAPEAMIDIIEPYVAVAPHAEVALRFKAMRGSSTIVGGQLVGTTNMAAHGAAIGLAVEDSRGLQVTGLKILEHTQPLSVARTTGFMLRLSIANPRSQPSGSAATLRDCERGMIDILLSGPTKGFAAGVAVEGRVSGLRIDATGIDAAVVGGMQNRVIAAGRTVTIPYRDANLIVDAA